MIKNDTIAVVSTWEIIKKWYVKNDPGDLCKRFGTSNLKNDLFWHNCNCVKFHQNDKISSGLGRTGFLEFNHDSTSQFGV